MQPKTVVQAADAISLHDVDDGLRSGWRLREVFSLTLRDGEFQLSAHLRSIKLNGVLYESPYTYAYLH